MERFEMNYQLIKIKNEILEGFTINESDFNNLQLWNISSLDNYYVWNSINGDRKFLTLLGENNYNFVNLDTFQYKNIFQHFVRKKQIVDVFSNMNAEKIDSSKLLEQLNQQMFDIRNCKDYGYKCWNRKKLLVSDLKNVILNFNLILDNFNGDIEKLPIELRIPTNDYYDWHMDFKLYPNYYMYYKRDIITSVENKNISKKRIDEAAIQLFIKFMKLNGYINLNDTPIIKKVKFVTLV